MCLIAVTWDLSLWIAIILEVAVALGMVIFVHELGHFVVAKLCGVKCEKFYLGFDVYGLKLWKFRWGETEYGIGILPLGGYVKMLGQEDNPGKLREEIERAKRQAEVSPSAVEGGAVSALEAPADKPRELAAVEQALFDPRSYLAQSVPKRMAIISAGVIMNVVFALVCATVAYRLGVKEIAAGVGAVIPGEAAWKGGIRVGDRIEEIAGHKIERYTDVMKNISLGDNIAAGIPLVLQRPGVARPVTLTVVPDQTHQRPTIGVLPPFATTLDSRERPTLPGTSAAQSNPQFESGDTIVALDGQPVESYAQIEAYFAEHPDKTIQVAVQRALSEAAGKTEAAANAAALTEKVGSKEKAEPTAGSANGAARTQRLTIDVAPRPIRTLGLEMTMGEICAIQNDLPAAKAGLRAGDFIRKADGEPLGDPMTWPARLRQRTSQTVTLTVEREGGTFERQMPLQPAHWYGQPIIAVAGSPVNVPQLGIAYRVLNRVASVAAGSPAAKAGIQAGDVILKAAISPPDEKTVKKEKLDQEAFTLDFEKKERHWPFFCQVLQNVYPTSQVEFQLSDDRKVTLEPLAAADLFNPDRGLRFDPEEFTQTAHTFGEALALGGRETVDALTMVVAVLRKIGTQISPKQLGGPGTIAAAAGHAAYEGFASLLIFLTIISANLAVLNFLPIPLLDGGHMVFLAWEGIRGKPADERVQLALTYLGLIFILGLMIWVIGLDMMRFLFRQAAW